MSGNEASAIGSLRAINSSQAAFSSSCANGFYAGTLPNLGLAPANGTPFISPDLGAAASVTKSGFTITMAGTAPATAATINACNTVAAASLKGGFYANANPTSFNSTGTRYFWTNTLGTIYQDTTATIAETVGTSAPTQATATPLQ